MVQNEKELDKLTGNLVKKSSVDEPSAGFTDSVMQSVLAVPVPVNEAAKQSWNWLLLVFPAMLFGGWYLYAFPEVLRIVLNFFGPFFAYLSSITSIFTQLIQSLLSFTFSPFILVVASAIFILLITDFIFSRKKIQV